MILHHQNKFYYSLLALAVLFSGGCATVMSEGTGSGLSADAQDLSAKVLEKGTASLMELVKGKYVSIRIMEERVRGRYDAELFYTKDLLRETVISANGRYVGETGGDIGLEIYLAKPGINATERSITAPINPNVNIPMFYSEGMESEAYIIILVRDSKGGITPWKTTGEQGETQFYLFRVIGPYRP